ncbi:hypothetical protein MYX77_02615 [Acidobacteriia bacterium AH_259_A11_L15]|nr:hypothetical protein [Acidobacteriia bacterium AH_259_A11_L15]
MALEVKTRQESGVAGVAPRGKLTMEHGAVLHEEVKKLVNGGARRLLAMSTIPSILAFDPALPNPLKNLAGA